MLFSMTVILFHYCISEANYCALYYLKFFLLTFPKLFRRLNGWK